jgi:hypothetical protein
LKAVGRFNFIQRPGLTHFNTVQYQPFTSPKLSGEITARASGSECVCVPKNESGHDTYATFDVNPAVWKKSLASQQTPPVKTPQGFADEVMHRRPNES